MAISLAKSLCAQKELQTKLEEKAGEIEEYASRMEELAEDRAKQLKTPNGYPRLAPQLGWWDMIPESPSGNNQRIVS